MPLIRQVCKALGISVGNFFAEGNWIEVTPELKARIEKWMLLSTEEAAAVDAMLDAIQAKKS
jgi:hypothetical protein